jgi:hypothetical protein
MLSHWHVDVRPDARVVLFIHGRHQLESCTRAVTASGWYSVRNAFVRAQAASRNLQVFTQATPSLHQSSIVRRLQWLAYGYFPHDSCPAGHHRPIGQCQCVVLYGFWVVVCELVDANTRGVSSSMGRRVPVDRIRHRRRPSRSSQAIYVQLWSSIYVSDSTVVS